MIIGKVISIENSPNTREFWFIADKDLKVGEIVRTEENVIGKVVEIINTNKYFSNAYSIKEFINSGKEISEIFPLDKWDLTISKASVICSFNDGKIGGIEKVVKAGSSVYKLDKDAIYKILGLDFNGINIGYLKSSMEIEVKLNFEKTFRKHCCIIAQSGYGKSYTVQVMIEEILNYNKKVPPIIVIDVHGEYKGFAIDPNFSAKTNLIDLEDVKFACYDLTSGKISEILPELSDVAKRELSRIFPIIKEKKKVFDLNDVILEVERSVRNENTKSHLTSWLNFLNSLNLFDKVDSFSISDLLKPNKLIIFDLSSSVDIRKKQTFLAILLRKIFDLRFSNRVPPCIIFIEESHQFAPEQEEKAAAISRGIIEKIAREGRKFGLSLVLISQRPIQLSKTALSQCDTKIIMHLSNPYDIEHIGESVEQLTNEELSALTSLSVGEAFVCGEVVRFPILVKIREKSVKTITQKSFEELLENF